LSHRIIARYLSVVLLTLESLGATAQTIAVSPPLITYAHTCRKKCVSACPVMRRRSRHIRIRSEQFEFVKLNAKKFDWRDTYHLILTLSWPRFAGFVFGVYLLINILFALLYLLNAHAVAEMPVGSFPYAFFFSVETLATVGYGHMYPDSLYGHLVSTLEIMVGMFGLAVITGLISVRFSRPTARLHFSRVAVIAPFDGVPNLMIRVANLRHQAMVEPEFRMILLRSTITLNTAME
jgi:inward rectifier potassium channel